MRLRMMTDDYTVFLMHGGEVKAFLAEHRAGRFYWAVMPHGPSGTENSPEEALASIRESFEQGLDVVATEEGNHRDVTEVHLPAIRKRQLRYVTDFEVVMPVSGSRQMACTVSFKRRSR